MDQVIKIQFESQYFYNPYSKRKTIEIYFEQEFFLVWTSNNNY